MKLSGSTKILKSKTKNEEHLVSLAVAKAVLAQCNLVDIQDQLKSEILYTFTLNKSYAYSMLVKSHAY